MPFNHLEGRRKRDRLELDLKAINRGGGELENLTPEVEAYVDQATACALDLFDFRGADTFDRADLYAMGMGVILLKQVWDRIPEHREMAFAVVMRTIHQRIELLEKATPVR